MLYWQAWRDSVVFARVSKEKNAMRIIMRQRLLSILDHYEIFDEAGRLLFKVSGKVAIAPELRIQNA